MSLRRSLVCTTLVVAAACSSSPTPATSPDPVAIDWTQTGIASWYGSPFHGRRTANGEVYDMDQMTAAHRTLPFDTRVRVENLDNGRVTEVRINDRGPFVDDRIIDLSRAAAQDIGMISSGTAPVRLIVIGMPSGCRLVQVGAFADTANARELADQLRVNGYTVHTQPGPDGVTRVIIGPYDTEDEAVKIRDRYDGVIQPCQGALSRSPGGRTRGLRGSIKYDQMGGPYGGLARTTSPAPTATIRPAAVDGDRATTVQEREG